MPQNEENIHIKKFKKNLLIKFLKKSFITSEKGCIIPHTKEKLGPKRLFEKPNSLRSYKVRKAKEINIKIIFIK